MLMNEIEVFQILIYTVKSVNVILFAYRMSLSISQAS